MPARSPGPRPHLRPIFRLHRGPLLLAWLAVAAPSASAAVVLPLNETVPDPDRWRAWVAAATAGHPDAAALQDMLDVHGTDLIATPDGGLLSLRQAVATLPDAVRDAAAVESQARFGTTAREALDKARGRPDHTPDDLAAVAARWPLCAADARAAAAARALDQGDADAARVLNPGDPRLADVATGSTARAGVGPVPFAADWYAKLNNFGEPRVVPVGSPTAGTFVADDRGVLATGPDGREVWHHGFAPGLDPTGTGRGPLCVPAVPCDIAGRPQLVVARHGPAVTALRASDGRLFWTTAGDPAWAELSALGPPTVAGRLVLVVALSTPPADAATLQLVAADVTDGRPLWRCVLGTVAGPVRRPGQPRGLRPEVEPFRDASPPTVAGDLVLVADNAGAVMAVDRFGGDVRWVRPYTSATVEGNPGRWINGVSGRLPPLPRAAVLRWSAAPVVAGDVVYVAPQDTADAFGLDRRTGRVLWQTASLPDDATCVGVVGRRFVLGGQSVTYVDPATGTPDGLYTPPAGVVLTGPPAVRDGGVTVLSTGGLLHPEP